MSHQVESMFSVKETPWHGLGVVIQNAPGIVEGIRLAGLDWEVRVDSLFRDLPVVVTDPLTGELVTTLKRDTLDDFGKVFVRSTDNSVLGIVGPNTHPLQNVKAFEWFQPFLDAKEAELTTAGSLCDGRKVWVMARLNRDNAEIVKGDEVAKFILLSNSHDGTTAIRVGFTPVRVVCANTLAMAHGDKASKLIRVRHSAKVETNLEKIRDVMNAANAEFEATAEQYRFLASRQISQADLRKYVKLVLDVDPDKSDDDLPKRTLAMIQEISDRHEKRTNMVYELAKQSQALQGATLDAIMRAFEEGRGTDNKASRGSYWTAYNAFTEWASYDRGHKQDTRLNSLWFGESARQNVKALEVALEMANAAA